MTQAQEPAAEPVQTPAAHSQWKYTGETDGAVTLNGTPIANVTKGQIIAAEDEVQAEKLLRSGHFDQVDGPQVALPTLQPLTEPEVLNAPPVFDHPIAPGGTE